MRIREILCVPVCVCVRERERERERDAWERCEGLEVSVSALACVANVRLCEAVCGVGNPVLLCVHACDMWQKPCVAWV